LESTSVKPSAFSMASSPRMRTLTVLVVSPALNEAVVDVFV